MFGLIFNIYIFFFKIGAFVFLVDLAFFNMLDRFTYDDLENFATTIGWKLLRLYSKTHIFSNNYIIGPFKHHVLNPVAGLIKSNLATVNEKDRIIFVKDGNEIQKYKSKDIISSKNVTEYDFILFYPDDEGTLVLDNINNIPSNNENFSAFNSKCGFMCCQLTITFNNDTTLKKTLEIEEFCMNANKILDDAFVKWYCNKNFSKEMKIIDIKTYKINIIDNDVNEVLLTPDDFILIDKRSYKIYNKKQKEPNVVTETDHIKILNDNANDNTNDNATNNANNNVNDATNIDTNADKKESSDEDIEKIESLEEEPSKKENNNSSIFSWFYKNDLGSSKKDV